MAAETYRENPRFNTEDAIREVGVGEAVTSFLQPKGVPGIVERTLVRPPSSKLGPVDKDVRTAVINNSPIAGKYETLKDRESAYEILTRRAAEAAREVEEAEKKAAAEKARDAREAEEEREYRSARRYSPPGSSSRRTSSRSRKEPESLGEAFGKAIVKELGGTTGRRIVRGILGGLFKSR